MRSAPAGPEITVDSTIEDSAVVVRVSDNGAGIPPEHIDRIFEPFFTTKGAHGTGLGLSSAREIMESIGGSISAVNRAGGGAVFVLRFPLVKPRAEAAGAQAPADVSGGCRFLLVDDDAENLDSLKEILVRDGHQADTALSRPTGPRKRSTIQPRLHDVILCDLGMPGMNRLGSRARGPSNRRACEVFISSPDGAGRLSGRLRRRDRCPGVLSSPSV